MKHVSIFKLKPEMHDEYKRRHDEIWPEMLELLTASGIRNYSLWNNGDQLVEYFETDDLESCCRILAGSEVKKRWDVYMSDIISFHRDATGMMTPLTLMFEFNSNSQ